MTDVNVNNTPEAMYVRALKWDFDGTHYVCRGIPETIKDKLKDIFNSWGIGHDGDRKNCKGNTVNVNVSERQWRRVKFTIERPKQGPTKEEISEVLDPLLKTPPF